MDPYLDRNDGRLRLGDVLDAGGLRQQDLPTLPRFCWPNGRSFLCWSSTFTQHGMKYNSSILAAFMRFLTKVTGGNVAAGIGSSVAALENKLKTQ